MGSGPASWQPPAPSGTELRTAAMITWNDVPDSFWATRAIDFVGGTYDWMRDYAPAVDGTYPFYPNKLEKRKLFVRAVVKAFAPDAQPDPNLTFPDLASDDPFFPYANVAASNGWLWTGPTGNFRPDEPVTMSQVHRALVKALGFGDIATGLNQIHTTGGYVFPHKGGFGTLLLGMRMGLRYNHSDESLDVGPASAMPRSEVAYSLWKAANMPSWMHDSLLPYQTIELPWIPKARLPIVEWGIRYVGYPYVWGGEWDQATGNGYCCGSQPVGGFDCSGLTWWVIKRAAGSWDNAPPRPYEGWNLPERTSASMAAVGERVWRFDDLVPGDLMFYDGDGDGTVDHVDVYLGNGWSVDSSSGMGGVTILQVDSGWYRDHFVHGRHLIG